MTKFALSVIVPVFNEQGIVGEVLAGLQKELNVLGFEYEILVINDGSSDRSGEILRSMPGVRVIEHPYNKGNGASIKTGARLAKYDWIMCFDSDGQHKPEYIKNLVQFAEGFDMVVGARQGYQGPWIRQPGKKILTAIASYLVDFKIPDLTSGMRIFRKKEFMRFIHLYPDSFSLYTTSTLAFLKSGLNVRYVSITINPRVGSSTVAPRHALSTFILITRIITLFSPMRFFLPVSIFCGSLAAISLVFDMWNVHITSSTVILFISTVLLFCFGILLDQISAVRRELNNHADE